MNLQKLMSWGKWMNNINNLKLIKKKALSYKNKAWDIPELPQNNKEIKAYHKKLCQLTL